MSANPTNGGTVTGGGTYQQGQSCTVHATPATGYTFLRWTENGTQVSSSANYTFTVNANRTLVAHFQVQSYNITATADPTNGGTVTGGGYYNYGQSCTLTAAPATGYTFVNWTRNGTQVSTNPSYTFTVTGAGAYVAHFEALPPCEAPNDVTASWLFYTDINISWSPVQNVETYKIYRNGTLITSGFPYTSYNDTELPYGEYCYTVVSECPQGDSEPSNESCVTLSIPCGAPSSFTADYVYVSEDDMGIQLEWHYTTMAILPEYFNLYRSNDGGANYELVENIIPQGTFNYSYFDAAGIGSYRYMLTAEYHFDGQICVSEAVYAETEVTSVSENGLSTESGNFTVYPNPVKDKLTIEAQETLEKVEIYNVMGALVYSQKSCGEMVEITTADLPTGTYVVRLTSKTATETRRFVKE